MQKGIYIYVTFTLKKEAALYRATAGSSISLLQWYFSSVLTNQIFLSFTYVTKFSTFGVF
jgi:hypothetical protein